MAQKMVIPRTFIYILLLLTTILSGCAGVNNTIINTKNGDTPVNSEINNAPNNSETLLKKLEGTWFGVLSKPTSWRPGKGNNRVLIIHVFGNELVGYYGFRIEKVRRVNLEVEIINDSIAIEFLTPANSRVYLRLERDGWLQGTFKISDAAPVDLQFIKEKK